MKKLIVLLLVALAVPAAFGELVKDYEFDFPGVQNMTTNAITQIGAWSTLNKWGGSIENGVARFSGWGTAPYVTPSWSNASLWQNTGSVFRPDTVYTLTARWYDGIDNGGQTTDIESIAIQIVSITEEEGELVWTDVAEGWDTPVAVEVWQEFTIQLDTATMPAVVGTPIGVGFRLTDNVSGAWVYVDYISLTYPQAGIVAPAHDTDPTDDLDEVGTFNGSVVDVTLEWTDAPVTGVDGHYLYFKEYDDAVDSVNDPNWLGIVPELVTGNTKVKAGLNPGSVYFWRVDERISGSAYDDIATIPGDSWAFETLSVTPIITADPVDILVAVGADAVFEASATSDAAFPLDSYEWYTTTDGVIGNGDDQMFDSGSLSGTQADITGTFSGVALTDAGKFVYCKVFNTSVSITSELALLEVERLVGHWNFEDNMTDESANAWTSVMTDPNEFVTPAAEYAAGIDNQAMDMTDIQVMQVTGTEEALNNYHLGLTFSAWVNTTLGNWQIVAGKQDRATAETQDWTLNLHWQGMPNLIVGSTGIIGTTPVNDGEWHLVTGTFDGSVARVYVDGELDGESAARVAPIDISAANAQPLEIGGETATDVFSYIGLLDDARIYNYALHPTQVLDHYNDSAAVAKNLCVGDYGTEFDVTGPAGVPDCKVDLLDFAQFAASWLTTGCYPDGYPCL